MITELQLIEDELEQFYHLNQEEDIWLDKGKQVESIQLTKILGRHIFFNASGRKRLTVVVGSYFTKDHTIEGIFLYTTADDEFEIEFVKINTTFQSSSLNSPLLWTTKVG